MPPPRTACQRVNGFVPIESYAVLGDGQTVALVASDGRIDWWPAPDMDSPPMFAAVVDPQAGGFLALAPTEPYEVSRRYVSGTAVLETRYTTTEGEAVVRDVLSVGRSGRLPWTQLIRRVDGVSGRVPLAWSVEAGDRFGTARPWTETKRGQVLVHLGDQHLVVRAFDLGPPQVCLSRVEGRTTVPAGGSGMLVLTSSDRAPVYVADRDEAQAHLDLSIDRWREWTNSVGYSGPWEDAVRRSALALKLLVYAPTGAIAAAPTTSLPERVGGKRNWDYRYMWVRDSSFTIDALIALGLEEEIQATMNWLLGTVRRTAPDLHVFYHLDGSLPGEVNELDAPGYRHSRPVRAGNSAAGQVQLGTFGDLFDSVWRYTRAGHLLDPGTGRMLAALADRCCDLWMTQDAGIWELDEARHFTISKIGCWVALDRAVRLAQEGEIATGHADRWAAERDEIKVWVDRHCWSADQRAYTFFAGSEELDAATLLAGRTGFDRGERLSGTVEAIRRELGRGPLVYRYTSAIGAEGCFLACTFWLVSALTQLGKREEARALMDQAVGLVNDVGLLAEEMDPDTGEMLGNFPQGLSHLALVNAATGWRAAGTRSELT